MVLTGASGFLARHVARRLLQDGYRVRATLRVSSREGEVRAAVLPGLPADAGGRLSFVQADLDADEGWAEAMEGAKALIHTASPVPVARPRDPDALVRLAVGGTRRALGAAAARVRRVVLTSSVPAIRHEGPADVQDEADWADPGARTMTPYARSKTLAEHAAWEMAAAQGLALTVINPGLILEPVLGPVREGAASTSAVLVARLLQGRDPVIRDLDVTVVDARDVAAAHVLSLRRPETAGERIAAVAGSLPFPRMARLLRDAYPDRRIPVRTAPRWARRLMSLGVPKLHTTVPLLGVPQTVSNAKARALPRDRRHPARRVPSRHRAGPDRPKAGLTGRR